MQYARAGKHNWSFALRSNYLYKTTRVDKGAMGDSTANQTP